LDAIANIITGKESTLDRIVRTRRARFELYRQYNVIRITADKTTAEYAANDIEEVLQNTASRKVNLRSWLPLLAEGTLPKDGQLQSLFSQGDLDVVSRLTRTNIAWTGNTVCKTFKQALSKTDLLVRHPRS
jgi:hypothetical protein